MMPALEAIRKSFNGKTVLDAATLSLRENGILCLLGPSGCGKSTLLRVAAGLLPPDGGRVLMNPADSAMVFQEPRLLPWLTVAENLGLALSSGPAEERRREIRRALDLVRLGKVETLMPRELSGGMAQRVGIARALLRRPKFLLMDEPFAALDAITRAELQKMLAALIADQGITCLFVTHDIDEALTIADAIHVMRDGKIMPDCFLKGEEDRNLVKPRILAWLQSV